MRGVRLAIGALLSLAWAASPAEAAWLEATTDHFVIDAASSDQRLRTFASSLERFDAALRAAWQVADDPTAHANPVRIFATNAAAIQLLAGPNVGGFYHTNSSGPVIVTATLSAPPRKAVATGSRIPLIQSEALDAQSTLFHEYSHHFMFSAFPRAFPMWFTEGFAEFNATAIARDDGAMVFGSQPPYRRSSLGYGASMPMKDIFAPPKFLDLDMFYAQSWLLTHDLLVEGHRQAQLTRYLDAIGAGKDSLAAAKEAFGDIDQLGREIARLANRSSLTALVVDPGTAPVTVSIRELSPGASAMMPVTIRAEAGSAAPDGVMAADAERTAAPYPGDVRVQVELARIELGAKRLDQADAAADRALAGDARDMAALLVKGRIAMRRLSAAKSQDKSAWKHARAWFVRANNGTPNAAEPLALYYQSFVAEGGRAPDIAYQGLLRAQQLAPDTPDIDLLIAGRQIDQGDIKAARATLAPLAYSPHENKEVALKAIEALDADKRDAARMLLSSAAD